MDSGRNPADPDLHGVVIGALVLHQKNPCPRLVGSSLAMQVQREKLRPICDSDGTVLILGESGTGKELAARTLVECGRRAKKPFVAVNCAAMTETLMDSELFGHVKGSFTGATENKPGRFVAAHGGTLLLDEVGEMPLSMQAKLLRVLQERDVYPVGSDTPRKVDVRVLAATHRDLEAMVREGEFRQDLFFRLKSSRSG
jgi:two-component system, NtrC family, response regulator HydG